MTFATAPTEPNCARTLAQFTQRTVEASTSDTLDLELWWPDLFEGLSPRDRRSIVQAFAGNWHEGWVPNREDVKDLTDLARGAFTKADCGRRSLEKAKKDSYTVARG
ncbi:MAG TPA: hypothetical protein VMU68_09425 [Acidimicrobiales bacterium]|nr:hypothetical protein [Acidimicrobiales bacterium]